MPEEDAIYRQIGRLVVFFQLLENQFFQLATFAADPQQTGKGKAAFADVWFKRLVKLTEEQVATFLHRQGRDAPEFRARVHAVLDRALALAAYRNRVVHSAYLFLEGRGQLRAVIRSDMTKGPDDRSVELDQESLDSGSFEEALAEIAEVVFDLSICRTQLIHWYRAAG